MGLHDECGVVGIFGCENAASLTYFALVSLQHRGQESAGIAVSDGEKILLHKDMGLVGDIFAQDHFEQLQGNISVGHVRYATAGGRTIDNAQPFLNTFKLGSIALAHNGQLVNYEPLREMLEDSGYTFSSTSDTEVILKLIARTYKKGLEKSLFNTLQLIKGSYALCIITENSLIGVRDPNGIRPLCLGKVGDGYILASESCAIDAVNGEFIRDVEPGETVIITKDGLKSYKNDEKMQKQTCVFEYVYFARGDSIIDNISVWEARYRMGKQLALETRFDADMVVGVPSSGIAAAIGYSAQSGIPYLEGILRSSYIGRSFILPNQEQRGNTVQLKLAPVQKILEGKNIILVDDSLVRGTTMRHVVSMLKDCGAKKIYLCVSSPPIINICSYGIDMGTPEELIATQVERENLANVLGCDEVYYLSYNGMINAVGHSN